MLSHVSPGSVAEARADIARLLHPETQCPAAVHSRWSHLGHLYQPCSVESEGKLCARHRRAAGDYTPALDRQAMLARLRGICRRSRISSLSQLASLRPNDGTYFFGQIAYAFVQKAIADGDTADLQAVLFQQEAQHEGAPCLHCGGTGIEPVVWA
jgi:hypothetical protein